MYNQGFIGDLSGRNTHIIKIAIVFANKVVKCWTLENQVRTGQNRWWNVGPEKEGVQPGFTSIEHYDFPGWMLQIKFVFLLWKVHKYDFISYFIFRKSLWDSLFYWKSRNRSISRKGKDKDKKTMMMTRRYIQQSSIMLLNILRIVGWILFILIIFLLLSFLSFYYYEDSIQFPVSIQMNTHNHTIFLRI